MKNVISKELFIEVINELIEVNKYCNDLNKFFRDHDCDGYVFQPDCSVSVIKLLNSIFEEEYNLGDESIISYFCFELDYGKKWKEGCITDSNGNDIKISTPEELYEYLINK